MAAEAKTISINIRSDVETKNSFSELCKELGLSVSSALNMIMKSAVRNREIPVELNVIPKPVAFEDMSKQDFIDMVEEGRKQIREGNYYTEEEFMKELDTLGKKYGL